MENMLLFPMMAMVWDRLVFSMKLTDSPDSVCDF
jgi:hypothetical protein